MCDLMSSEQFREFFCSCHTHTLDHRWHVSASLPSEPRPTACRQMSFVQIKEPDTDGRTRREEASRRGGCWGSELQLCIGHLSGRGWSFSIFPSTEKQRLSNTHKAHAYIHTCSLWLGGKHVRKRYGPGAELHTHTIQGSEEPAR